MYEEEARERWGHTDAYKESQKRVVNMGTDGLKQATDAQEAIARQIGLLMNEGKSIDSGETQAVVLLHYEWLRNFYEPTPEMYEGLAAMYVQDERFAKYYEDIVPGLSVYLSDAMRVFTERRLPGDGMLVK